MPSGRALGLRVRGDWSIRCFHSSSRFMDSSRCCIFLVSPSEGSSGREVFITSSCSRWRGSLAEADLMKLLFTLPLGEALLG